MKIFLNNKTTIQNLVIQQNDEITMYQKELSKYVKNRYTKEIYLTMRYDK